MLCRILNNADTLHIVEMNVLELRRKHRYQDWQGWVLLAMPQRWHAPVGLSNPSWSASQVRQELNVLSYLFQTRP